MVTGANFLLETSSGSKILIDCGLMQGEKFAMEENSQPFAYDLSSISALCVTHAHLDHVGRIPKLVRDGFKGTIYSTPETRALAELVLDDAVNILKSEAEQDGLSPLYGPEDVRAIFPLWQTIPYHDEKEITGDVSIYLKDAGHILGSSMIEFRIKASSTSGGASAESSIKKILFTGDLGNSPAPLLRDTEDVGDVQALVMESTYGDRNHEPKEERSEKFEQIVKQTLARGGTLVIPAFSIDRTQVILFELNNMVEKKIIPSVPVFVDSPLAIKTTQVYESSSYLFNDAVKEQIKNGDNIFAFPHLEYTMNANDSKSIDKTKGAKIILAGSGMSMGGRVTGHEGYFLPDEKNTILLVGYQTLGSLGRKLADGAKKVTIQGQEIKVKAHIEELYGFSAHKDGDHLVQFVSTGTDKLKQVFVVMGEPKASIFLAQRLNDELGAHAIVPEKGKEYGV